MHKTVFLCVTASILSILSDAFCGTDDDLSSSSEEINQGKMRGNLWVSPIRAVKDIVQIEKEFRGDTPCWAEQDLIECAQRFSRTPAAILVKDPGELHLKVWHNGPGNETFENYAFNWAVWRGQVAVLKHFKGYETSTNPLAQEIDIFRKYESIWGQAGRDVKSVFESYYRWTQLKAQGKNYRPFEDKNLPFYMDSLTRTPGEYLPEREMAFFMEYIERALSHTLVGTYEPSDSDRKYIYYDHPSTDQQMGVTERFIQSEAYLKGRLSQLGARFTPEAYNLDDFLTLAKYGIFFDEKMWSRFANFLINPANDITLQLTEPLLLSVFKVVPEISKPDVCYRMAMCYLRFAGLATSDSLQIHKMTFLKLAVHWTTKLQEYIEERKALLCDADTDDMSPVPWAAMSKEFDVGKESSEGYELFSSGQRLFLNIEAIILQSEDEVLGRFLGYIQNFITRMHIREAEVQRHREQDRIEQSIHKEEEAQKRDLQCQSTLISSDGVGFETSPANSAQNASSSGDTTDTGATSIDQAPKQLSTSTPSPVSSSTVVSSTTGGRRAPKSQNQSGKSKQREGECDIQ